MAQRGKTPVVLHDVNMAQRGKSLVVLHDVNMAQRGKTPAVLHDVESDTQRPINWHLNSKRLDDDDVELHVLGCRLTY